MHVLSAYKLWHSLRQNVALSENNVGTLDQLAIQAHCTTLNQELLNLAAADAEVSYFKRYKRCMIHTLQLGPRAISAIDFSD